MLPQGKGTNEGTEMVSEKRIINGITTMLPDITMANEKTKIMLELELEGNPSSEETTIMLKKEFANGETTKLHCMNSNARCPCCQSVLVDIAMKETTDEDVLQKKEMNHGKSKGLMDKEVSNGETYHMNSGDDLYSYGKYSCYQKAIVKAAKKILVEAISDHLDISPSLGSFKTLRIADMGCSVGPNTFIAMQNIIEAVKLKYQTMQQNLQALEFHVFFNDHVANDFNSLFRCLPPSRPYFAVGVPGSFHGRLFPNSSLHIIHSSYALHWLSKIPKEVTEINFRHLKNGRKYCMSTDEEVLKAFSSQYKKDIQTFLNARAQELVGGGFMVLLIVGIQNEASFSKCCGGMVFDIFGSCLMDMANAGLVTDEKVYSFQLPLYYTTPKEFETLIETNGNFNIEKIEILVRPMEHESPDYQICSFHFRAAMEGLVEKHFGKDIIEELFDRYTKKLGENTFIFDEEYRKETHLFIFLRRKITENSSEE